MPRFAANPASFVHSGGTMNLRQLDSLNFRPNSQKTEVVPAGSIDRAAVILANAAPELMLTTADLATALATITPSVGLSCSSGASVRYARRLAGSTYSVDTNNYGIASSSGHLYLGNLGASQDGADGARLDLRYLAFSSDGFANPFTVDASADFSETPSPAFNSHYFFGAVVINGTKVPKCIRSAVDFGLQIIPERSCGAVFATDCYVNGRRPTMSFTTHALSELTSPAIFAALLAGTLDFYYYKGVSGGARTSGATHIKVSCASGEYSPDDLSIQGNDDGTLTYTVMPIDAAPSISLTATIPS